MILIILLLLLLLLSTSCLSFDGNAAQYCSCCSVTSATSDAPGYSVVPSSGGNPINVTPGGNGTNTTPSTPPDPEHIGLELYDYNNTSKELRLIMTILDGSDAPTKDNITVTYQELNGTDNGPITVDVDPVDYGTYKSSSYLVKFVLPANARPPISSSLNPYTYNVTFDGTSASVNYPFESGTGAGTDSYKMNHVVQFDSLRYYTESAGSGKYFELTTDIVCPTAWNNVSDAEYTAFKRSETDGKGWQPVGNSTTNAFKGNFNGRSKSVSDFSINRSTVSYAGLFGSSSSGSFKNVNLENFNMNVSGNSGGFIGQNTGSSVENVNISNSTVRSNASNAGGLIGNNTGSVNTVNLTNVAVNATYWAAVKSGGMIGDNTGSIDNVTMSNISVKSDFCELLGGMIGNNAGAINNVNLTDVIVDETWQYSGGLIGNNTGSINNVTLTNATVNSSSYSGGLIGGNNATVNCVNLKNVTINTQGGQYSGGMVGYNSGSEINQINSTDIVVNTSSVTYVGGLIGYSHNSTPIRISSVNSTNVTVNATKWHSGGMIGYCNGSHSIDVVNLTNATVNTSGASISYSGGLIGYNDNDGSINNTHLLNCAVLAPDNAPYIGGLVGDNRNASINNSDFIWDQTAGKKINGGKEVGGFVGMSTFTNISNCYVANFSVSGHGDAVGGFMGSTSISGVPTAECTLLNISARNVDVSNTGNRTGGLVGHTFGTSVRQSYATGDVNVVGSSLSSTGGLLGQSSTANVKKNGNVEQCYATGNVTGDKEVGGLIGYGESHISDCYAMGDVDGDAKIGSLIGAFAYNYTVDNCYAIGNVTGSDYVGLFGSIQRIMIPNVTGVNNSVILNGTITGLTNVSRIGTQVGSNTPYYKNNYAIDTIPGTWTPDINGKDGGTKTAAELVDTFFSGTGSGQLGWDFTDVWEWNSTLNRPVLKGMPAA
ncbi:beta strand repeat-containing protein [Methanolapillus africanus]|uniref:beta strand repeat-containing protein n=1 Tax=Methanolapillus africanus TaxID=3028297 RepID=UPI0030B8D15F